MSISYVYEKQAEQMKKKKKNQLKILLIDFCAHNKCNFEVTCLFFYVFNTQCIQCLRLRINANFIKHEIHNCLLSAQKYSCIELKVFPKKITKMKVKPWIKKKKATIKQLLNTDLFFKNNLNVANYKIKWFDVPETRFIFIWIKC